MHRIKIIRASLHRLVHYKRMLEIKNISFAYDEKTVIHDISFSVEKGQNIAVIGESGCGKSTLLKLIYGLYDLNQGEITWDGEKILGPKYHLVPGASFIKYLAQDFDLMPYITVEENVGKYLSNIRPEEKKQRVYELLDMVEMTAFAKTKAKYLSGGQQQRVALAKVLANEPEILLLDEPFSHIDSFRKNALRRNLFAYLKSKNIICIVATHDSVDALSFADETIVMQKGAVVTKDHPAHMYLYPKNKYVASLFGEVNEIQVSKLMPFENEQKKVLLYPHELFVHKEGYLNVIIKNTYFKGDLFLIKAFFENQVVFFEHPVSLPINEMFAIAVDPDLILERINYN